MNLASWQILDGTPKRLRSSSVGLERDLEDWIVQEPSLIDHGLSILARQTSLDGGNLIPDLIGQNAAGALVLIEIKATKLHRKTFAQALDYASILREMPSDELSAVLRNSEVPRQPGVIELDEAPRDVEIVLVGIGEDTSASRVADFLQTYGLPVRSVAFEVVTVNGRLVLLREDDEITAASTTGGSPGRTVDDILAQAATPEMQLLAKRVLEIATRHGLALRPYTRSIMITPPQNRTRFLMLLKMVSGRPMFLATAEPFIEFFEVDDAKAHQLLDEFRVPHSAVGEVALTDVVADNLEQALDSLFDRGNEADADDLAGG